jgi:hypothetical protein
MEEEVVYPNPFVGEELEIMCHRAVLNLRKTRLEQEIKEYSALFKFATPEMESFKKLADIVQSMVDDLTDVNEKLKEAI